MAAVGLGLLGCGIVGSAVVRRLAAGEGPAGMRIAGVAVKTADKARDCRLPAGALTTDSMAVVEDPSVDVVVEVMGGVAGTRRLIERALELGKPVVTANKALLGALGPEVRAAAVAADVPLLFEAAVGGAVPIVRSLQALGDGDRIVKLEGVLNGTANYVLSQMETAGTTMAEAVGEARRLGYAEADPARDLDGRDTADKVALLAQLAFGEALRSGDIPRLGIEWLQPEDLAAALGEGRHWRLLGTAVAGCAKVEPAPLRAEHPLARLPGAENGILVTTLRAGTLWFGGAGAGGEPTATAVLGDVATAGAWVREGQRRPSTLRIPEAVMMGT